MADKQGMNPIAGSPLLPGASSNGLSAIATATQKLDADAQQVANRGAVDDTAALVDLNQALALAQAGANVIRAENNMVGTLLDAFA